MGLGIGRSGLGHMTGHQIGFRLGRSRTESGAAGCLSPSHNPIGKNLSV